MRRVCIVFEEVDGIGGPANDPGPRFNVYLEGADKARLQALPPSEWSTAEYWAVACFQIVAETIRKVGAVESVSRKPGV
jgi:hypothetical protein